MSDSRNPYVGIEALLTPQDCVLLLIDHQAFQFANLHSHEPTLIVNNVAGLAKTAKAFRVPTILTTVLEDRGGLLIKDVQDVFPDQKPINRTFINAWEDKRDARWFALNLKTELPATAGGMSGHHRFAPWLSIGRSILRMSGRFGL